MRRFGLILNTLAIMAIAFASASARAGEVTLLNVSYDPTREFYSETQ